MRDKGMLKKLQEIRKCLFDESMNSRVEPIGEIGKMGLDIVRLRLLTNLLEIIGDTDIVNTETKVYIFNDTTKREVNEVMKVMTGNPDVSFNTTQSKIHYGKVKLEETIGQLLDDLLDKDTNAIGLSVRVGKLYKEYGTNSIMEDISLKLDKTPYNSELTDEEFSKLLELIKPYFKIEIDKVVEQITDDMAGYLNFLGTRKYMGDIDIERFNQLKELMGNDVYTAVNKKQQLKR